MAYYEMMPAGLPAGLQSGMDSVLNKKFGTATSYAPGTWPDTVNLMGPLPEKTASGSIAHITDGADEVPIKSLKITVAPTLSGVSEVTETQMGTNAWNEEWELGIWNSQAEKSSSNNAIRSKDYIPVFSSAEYYIYCDFSVYSSGIIFRLLDENKSFVRTVVVNSSSTKKITMDSSVKYIVWCSSTVDGITTYSDNVSVNYPSTITSYEPYVAPTTHTADLGRTVYGGSVDVVKGEGTDENGNDFTFTPITPTPETALGVNNFWAVEGDTEVTYRADINLALQALSGSRGLMMARPQLEPETEPEETIEETPEEMER